MTLPLYPIWVPGIPGHLYLKWIFPKPDTGKQGCKVTRVKKVKKKEKMKPLRPAREENVLKISFKMCHITASKLMYRAASVQGTYEKSKISNCI